MVTPIISIGAIYQRVQVYECFRCESQWVYNNQRLYSYEQYTESTELISPQTQITNYPNPFNPITTISFSLVEASPVNVCVYNVKGQQVKTLLHEDLLSGDHTITWDGTDSENNIVSSGVYFCEVQAAGHRNLKKMMLLK
jgi:flagellar hook assembly protein FlgD